MCIRDRPFSTALAFSSRVSFAWSAPAVALACATLCAASMVLVHLAYRKVCSMEEEPAPVQRATWFQDLEPKHLPSTTEPSAPAATGEGSADAKWTGQARPTRKMEVSGSSLAVSADICFPVRQTYLETMIPPIVFLECD